MPKYKNGMAIHKKGYPWVSSGPLRHKLIHRIVAAAFIGRELTKDEEVHHLDHNKLNFHWTNLLVLGHKDHSWSSARQAWFMRNKDEQEYAAWQEFMLAESKRWSSEVAACRAAKKVWAGEGDGQMKDRFEAYREERARNGKGNGNGKVNGKVKVSKPPLVLPPRDKDWMRASLRHSPIVPF